MKVIDDVAERRFSWLLRQRGCTFLRESELEKAIKVLGPRPDFHVTSPEGLFLAEVKSFAQAGPMDRHTNRVFSIGVEELMKPIRSEILEARRQLRPYRDLPIAR